MFGGNTKNFHILSKFFAQIIPGCDIISIEGGGENGGEKGGEKSAEKNADVLAVFEPIGVKLPPFPCEAVVIDGDDSLLASAIKRSGATVVTYGFNGRATVTLSSFSERGAVVCVQRSFVGARGVNVEPTELPLETRSFYGAPPAVLLCAVAAALASGVKPPEIASACSRKKAYRSK